MSNKEGFEKEARILFAKLLTHQAPPRPNRWSLFLHMMSGKQQHVTAPKLRLAQTKTRSEDTWGPGGSLNLPDLFFIYPNNVLENWSNLWTGLENVFCVELLKGKLLFCIYFGERKISCSYPHTHSHHCSFEFAYIEKWAKESLISSFPFF